MALLTAPARGPEAPPGAPDELGEGDLRASGAPGGLGEGGLRERVAARARSTPGRLTSLMVLLVVLGLAAGLAAVMGTVQRGALIDGVRTRSGPLTVQAQQLYRSLSDADATAANAFLSNGVEPKALRDRYQSDIAAASNALAAAAAASESDRSAVATITAQLPVYTGLVETARSYNRLNLPLGAAYLREASGVMRQNLLPAAGALRRTEAARLAADRGGAAQFPWLALPFGLLTLAGLVAAQVYLTGRTNRLLNVGLVTATAATLALVLWVGVSWLGVDGHLRASNRDGSAQVELLAQARIAALTARADEALTLVARGNGANFEDDFNKSMDALAGKNGSSGLLAQARAQATDPRVRAELAGAVSHARTWRTVHQKLRAFDDGGHYSDAVTLAIGADPASAASAFNRLDGDLGRGITTASAAFDREAGGADRDLSGATAGLAVLTVVLLAGVAAGLQQRIAEYR
jgi:hypothetical protein